MQNCFLNFPKYLDRKKKNKQKQHEHNIHEPDFLPKFLCKLLLDICSFYKTTKSWHVHLCIMKTRLYNFDPLKPHFYTVRLGFTGVYIIFLILLKNIDCGYSLETPSWGGSNKYPQSIFLEEIGKNIRIFIWKFFFFSCKIFNIF